MKNASSKIRKDIQLSRYSLMICALLTAPLYSAAQEPDVSFFGKPLPKSFQTDLSPVVAKQIALGHKLYFENELSKARDLSCNSCHGLSTYGADGQPTSPGHEGQRGVRNSPTVYNAAGHMAQFWDGRAADVEAQALGPVLNPVEMAMPSETEVVTRLKAKEGYKKLFAEAFPHEKDPITFKNMGKAIGAFERELVTPSRFDSYLAGDKTALTEKEKAGLRKFITTGCIACHSGTYLGGQMYQKVGLVHPWPSNADQGRFEVTKSEADRMVFKVPSLRNISETAPYFHDGSVQTLNEAVRLMAFHQLGKELRKEEIDEIVDFLKALKGTLPEKYLVAPKS